MIWFAKSVLRLVLFGTSSAKSLDKADATKSICHIEASMQGVAAKLNQAGLDCKTNSKIVVAAGDSLIDNAVVLTGLRDVEISFLGNLHLKPDPHFWHTHAYAGLPAFQNATSAITFVDCSNIQINGGDAINPTGSSIIGYGHVWWQLYTTDPNIRRPVLLALQKCKNATVGNLRILSPPFWAAYISKSRFVKISNYMVQVVGDDAYKAANSDGIDIRESSNVEVSDSYILNSDDCIAIKGMTKDIHIHDMTCGHKTAGLSVGSLGNLPNVDEYARNIMIEDINILDASRGLVRLKAWPGQASFLKELAGGGGRATVSNITIRRVHGTNTTGAIVLDTCYSLDKDNSDCYGAPSLATFDGITFDGIYSAVVSNNKVVGTGFISCTNPKHCNNVQAINLVLYSIETNRLVALSTNNIDQRNISGVPADIARWDKPLVNGCYLPRASQGTQHLDDALFYAPRARDRPLGYLKGVPKTDAECLAPGFHAPENGVDKAFKLSQTSYTVPVYPLADLSKIPKTLVVVPALFPQEWIANRDLPFIL